MKDDWWDKYFDDSLSKFIKIFETVISISLGIRFLLGLLFSFNSMFYSPQKEILIVVIPATLVMKNIRNKVIE